jgi:uncharacterized cupin superfamily protein
MESKKAIVHEDEVNWIEQSHGERFSFKRRMLGLATGAEKLGCSLFEVAPGKRAWPFHFHFANEEALYILEGSGTLRLGSEEFAIGKGHFVTFRAGADSPHQLINTGTAALRYICFSTMHSPEVAGYPDSKKIGVIGGRAPGANPAVNALRKVFRETDAVDYYDGE